MHYAIGIIAELHSGHKQVHNSLTLTNAELIELTGYRRASRQLRALADAGIKAWRRADGSVVVLRSQLASASAHGGATAPPADPRLRLNVTGLKR